MQNINETTIRKNTDDLSLAITGNTIVANGKITYQFGGRGKPSKDGQDRAYEVQAILNAHPFGGKYVLEADHDIYGKIKFSVTHLGGITFQTPSGSELNCKGIVVTIENSQIVKAEPMF